MTSYVDVKSVHEILKLFLHFPEILGMVII